MSEWWRGWEFRPEERLSIPNPRGGDDMGFVKHGSGEILPEPDDDQKTASANWSEEDQQALAEESND